MSSHGSQQAQKTFHIYRRRIWGGADPVRSRKVSLISSWFQAVCCARPWDLAGIHCESDPAVWLIAFPVSAADGEERRGPRHCSTRHSLSHQSSELGRSGLEAHWRKSGQEKSTQPPGTNKLDSCIFPHGLNPAGVCLYTCAQITERLACNVCDLHRG